MILRHEQRTSASRKSSISYRRYVMRWTYSGNGCANGVTGAGNKD